MATTDAPTATLPETDFDEVFVPVSATVERETCDKCGGTVKASYSVTKGATKLHFCAHHVREYAPGLAAKGFVIFPEDISFEAFGEDKRQGL